MLLSLLETDEVDYRAELAPEPGFLFHRMNEKASLGGERGGTFAASRRPRQSMRSLTTRIRALGTKILNLDLSSGLRRTQSYVVITGERWKTAACSCCLPSKYIYSLRGT